jgi:SagB-type dehydrogenase family enzyme
MGSDASSTALEPILSYHERTKHHMHAYARSLGYMDWDNQPDPFRRFEGSELISLDEVPVTLEPLYDSIYPPGAVSPRPLDRASVSQLFYDSLALSAWKEMGNARWSLRVNPSSGALHPTEGYMLAGPIPDLSSAPALYHYSPFRHALELRRSVSSADWGDLCSGVPADSVLVGLTSIYWRESWKYGERAFRYCHHDVGHAIAAIALSASALGWKARLLEAGTDDELATLLGVSDQRGAEAERPDCLLVVYPDGNELSLESLRDSWPNRDLLTRLSRIPVAGEPNRLSSRHHPWPVIDDVCEASARVESPAAICWEAHSETRPRPSTPELRQLSARRIIRQRRSAVAMDGRTGLGRDDFYAMLDKLMPEAEGVPFGSLPWKPMIHLVAFVHRVEGLRPGLYCLVREPREFDDLKSAFRPDFGWTRPSGCPGDLPLYRLAQQDCRDIARAVACHQDIASDGVFAAAMIARFEPSLREFGGWFYKRLFWETGMIGQVLYLEAEAAGVRGTGIGCFFDDAVHQMLGLRGSRYQDLYHFTVGGALEDRRLKTLPAYFHRQGPSDTDPQAQSSR